MEDKPVEGEPVEAEIEQLYSDELLDYAERKPLKEPDRAAELTIEGGNPFCGDRACLFLWLEGDKIESVRWENTGCIVSQAGAALCAELVTGKTFNEVASLGLENLQKQFGERIRHRFRCAMLCLWLLQEGLRRHTADPTKKEWRGISIAAFN